MIMDVCLCSFLSREEIKKIIRNKMNTKRNIGFERNDKRKKYVVCFVHKRIVNNTSYR